MSGITITGSVTINQGVNMGIGVTPPPAPAVTFSTPTIMNSGAFVSLLQTNGAAIDSSGLITVIGSNSGNFGSAVSSDGTTWTGPAQEITGSTSVIRVVWSSYHNYFLAVGTGASSYPIYTTSTDGINWDTPAVINAITIGNVYALAVNSAGVFAAIMIPNPGGYPMYTTSADGTTWTTPTTIPGADNGVYYFNASITVNPAGNFVVAGYNSFNSTPWYTFSADGSTWAALQTGSNFLPKSLTWSNYHNLFVTIGNTGSGLAYSTSTNGTTWTSPVSIAGTTDLMQIFSLKENPSGVLVGVGQIQVGGTGQPIYLTSTNATAWSVPTSFNGSTSIGYMRNILYSASLGKFVAVGFDSGTNWIYSDSVPSLTPALSLDAGNPASYPGSGATWTDTVGGMPFTLVNSPTYNSANGGYLQFNPGSGQYGYSTTNLGTLAAWSIEAWHYYDGTNTSSGPNIFTEYLYGGGTINLGLGSNSADTDLAAWWYGGGFHTTAPYTLTPGNWYQIVGTFNGTTLNLYVNNTLVQSATEPPGAAANPAIGYGLMTRWDPGGLWGGRLAILNLYNTDIGAAGVTTSWNANRARFGL